jgi:hypothetical protein
MAANLGLVRAPTGRLGRARAAIQTTAAAIRTATRARVRPVRAVLADHVFTLAGFGLVSAAFFQLGLFAGLLVTGVLVLVFEWKVSELCLLAFTTLSAIACAMSEAMSCCLVVRKAIRSVTRSMGRC